MGIQTPVVFQQYLNNSFGKKILTYRCTLGFSGLGKILNYNRSDVFDFKVCDSMFESKASASGMIHPYKARIDTCTPMLFTNLAEPEWVSVHCKEKIIPHVFCVSNEETNSTALTNVNITQDKNVCQLLWFAKGNKCYSFHLA